MSHQRKDKLFAELAEENDRLRSQLAAVEAARAKQTAKINVNDLAKAIKAAEEHRVRSSGRMQAVLSPEHEAFQWQGYLLCASIAIEFIGATQGTCTAPAPPVPQAEPQDCLCPDECDCESPDTEPALCSNECPEHNLFPRPHPECKANKHRNVAEPQPSGEGTGER